MLDRKRSTPSTESKKEDVNCTACCVVIRDHETQNNTRLNGLLRLHETAAMGDPHMGGSHALTRTGTVLSWRRLLAPAMNAKYMQQPRDG